MRPTRHAIASACAALLLAACGGDGDSGPTLSDRAPAPGALDATETYVMVKFSEAMDPASLAGGITVSRLGGGPVDGAVSADGALAYFIPAVPFPAAAPLEVTVSADVRSASGGRLGAPITWSFTTAHWRPVSTSGAPSARSGHTAVWTGTEVIVWGGTPSTRAGGRYDPATDSWRPTSLTDATPAGRTGHTAVWTGAEMIVWGGTVAGALVATGARYDPVKDAWTATSTNGAPSARSGHTAVWTGKEMIVWGGAGTDLSGGRYDPATDTWTATSLTGAPAIYARHRAVWTGTRMAVWGGTGTSSASTGGDGVGAGGAGIVTGPPPPIRTGALYDPAFNTWTAIKLEGAPSERADHALVWTGSEVLVWGGDALYHPVSTGGRYAPGTDSWLPTADAGAPSARGLPHAAWTGSRLLVWSGLSLGAILGDGALFDPSTDAWAPVSAVGAEASLQRGAASVWTGSELVVWGGEGSAVGARFTP